MAKRKTKQAGGPGRKQCPKCNQFVGVRTKTCECGHDFDFRAPAATTTASGSKPTHDQIALVLAAQSLIAKCGSGGAALELIKAVSGHEKK